MFLEICNNVKPLADKACSLEILKKIGKSYIFHECIKYMKILFYFIISHHKIYTNPWLKVRIKSKCMHKHRPYMVPFEVKGNVNKCKDSVLNHNCIQLTVVHSNNFTATSGWIVVNSSVASICLKCCMTLINSMWAFCL